jgi:hypothetical protein
MRARSSEEFFENLHRGTLGSRHVSQSGRHLASDFGFAHLSIKKSKRECQNAPPLNGSEFILGWVHAIRGSP